MFSKIAVAYEEHPESARALERALELAKLLGVPLTVLTIAEPLPAYTAFSAAANPGAIHLLEQDRTAFYESLKGRIAAHGAAENVEVSAHVLQGDMVRAIVDFVDTHGIELLVVGLHRRTLRLSSLWSTVYSLAQELTCSVLGVH